MQVRRRSVLAALAAAGAGLASRPALARQASDPPRPRILATSEDFERVRRLVDAGEEYATEWYGNVRSRASSIRGQEPVEYALTRRGNILDRSREVHSRVRTLGLLHRVGGSGAYAARAWRELEAAANFDTWHPGHFLDVAEMTAAFGIAYDWLYDYWDADQRETLRTAIVEKGLDLGIAAHEGRGGVPNWWTDDDYNWNSVCNGGLSIGALALVGEEGVDQAKLETLLSYTSEGIVEAFETFGEDGGWFEGYDYWGYNTRYGVYYLTSMLNTLEGSGMDVEAGVPDVGGFPSAGDFPMGMAGPQGAFNFADANPGLGTKPELFWLARRFDEPAWAAFQRRLAGDDGGVDDLLWYDPESVGSIDSKPRDMRFRGVDAGSFRTEWAIGGSFAGYVGFKGGRNGENHGDLDLGSFVYDAQGTRWAVDLGREDYNVPGYWGRRRWDYYRKRAEGHNTLVIDPDGGPDQSTTAEAPITAFETGEGGAYGIVDLSEAYRPGFPDDAIRRGFAFDRSSKALVVQDELSLSPPAAVWWFVHTRATPEVGADGRTATLGGLNRVRARILAPDGATFRAMDAGPLPSSPDPDAGAENTGVRKLAVDLEEVTDLRLAVELVPLSDGGAPEPPAVRPLDDWSVAHAAGEAAPGTATTTTTTTAGTDGDDASGGATDGPTTTSAGGPGFGTLGALGGAGLAAWRLARRRGRGRESE